MYKIIEATSKSEWEKSVQKAEYPAFFQSWEWGEVQKKENIEVSRFFIANNKKVVAAFQAFTVRARRGTYIHVRQGPVFLEFNNKIGEVFLSFIKKYAKQTNALFVRVSPLVSEGSHIEQFLLSNKTISSPIHNVDAENRWVLNLEEDEDTLMKNMRKTTRYLVRKGDNSDISYMCTKNSNDIKKFTKIYKETAKTKHFVPHKQIQTEFSVFSSSDSARLYLAYKNKALLAGAMIVYYADRAIYRHGATSEQGRNTPASYTLQWKAVTDAKKAGVKVYDFWGIAKDDYRNNPWFGLSQFKKGFGGYQEDFIHARDIPVSPFYVFPYAIDTITRIRKGH